MLRSLTRSLAPALALAVLVGCPSPRRPTPPPPPPPDLGRWLPPDAPLTAVAHPAALDRALSGLGLRDAAPLPLAGIGPAIEPALRGLGLDPERPVWLALRAGPVLGVLRAAEDAERVLADAAGDPIADPRLSPIGPFADGPFARWLEAHPLPPTWVHLRLIGHPLAGPGGSPNAPEPWLAQTFGALATVGPDDPAETLAAALDVEAGPAGALQAALGAHRPTVYRLLDRPLPTVVMAHRRQDPHPAVIVDVIGDRDLGPGALAAGLAALPEAGGVWETRSTPPPGPPAPGGLLRLELDHARWLAAARMLAEVGALQRVVGQGPTPAEAHDALAAGRVAARLPERLMAPVQRTLAASHITLNAAEGGLRARIEVHARSEALGALRGDAAPADHGLIADGLTPGAGPALALTLARPPIAVARLVAPHIGPPDRPLPALLEAIDRCGAPCLPALWTAPLAYARDLPATIAALSGHAPLDAALTEATGLAGLVIGDSRAAAVGHRAPATLSRAAWAPIVEAAGLESRWLVSDRAVMLAGRGPALDVLTRAARSPAVTDVALLRFTAVEAGPDRLRIDGAVTFDRRGVTLDAVIDRPPLVAP